MKQTTKDFLTEYICTHKYGRYVGYTFVDLFKLYSALEITDLTDISTKASDFCDFLEQSAELITCADPHYTPRIPHKIKMVRYHFNQKFNIRDKVGQKKFAGIVNEIAPSNAHTHILDIGASEFPYSSIILAKDFEHTTSMDRRFYLSNTSLHNMNVDPIETLFKDDADISAYDFIVGRFPCSAIESIVKVCTQTNKPYFIELCECKLPLPKALPADQSFGWQNVLPKWDPNVKIINGYATNIDATADQLNQLLSQQALKSIFEIKSSIGTKNAVYFELSENNFTSKPEEEPYL